jgi:hypothetical protein
MSRFDNGSVTRNCQKEKHPPCSHSFSIAQMQLVSPSLSTLRKLPYLILSAQKAPLANRTTTKKYPRIKPLTPSTSTLTTTMICTRCLRRASSLRPQLSFARTFTSTRPRFEPASPPATSTGLAQPFTNPLSPTPNEASPSTSLKPKPKSGLVFPISNCKAGTKLKGLNYLKGRDDPVALEDEEYPEWLWHCLDAKQKASDEEGAVGDLFCAFLSLLIYWLLIADPLHSEI